MEEKPIVKETRLLIEEDKQVIGNANPKFYGGLTNTFTFKGFDLSIFLNFSYGNDVFNATKFYTGLIGQSNRTSTAIYDSSNRWITVGADGQTITDANVLRAVNAGKPLLKLEICKVVINRQYTHGLLKTVRSYALII